MYTEKLWQDHVTEFEDRYEETINPDGSVTHVPIEGEIIQQGTPQNAKNFNYMEDGILAANEKAAYLMLTVLHQAQTVSNLNGEVGTVTLSNTEEYPFNNSIKTVALKQPRGNLDYRVVVESMAEDTGAVGEIIITEKQLNGFKLQHTGSAKKVNVKYIVEGGTY